MAKKEKFKRKQLKEADQFLTLTEHAMLYTSKHSKSIMTISGVALLLILAVMGFQYNKQVNSMRMESLYSDMTQLIKDKKDQDSKEVAPQLAKILEEFSNGSQKLRAKLLLADYYHRHGNYSQAMDLYNAVKSSSKSGDLQNQLATIGLAYSYEGKKEYKQGIELLRTLIDNSQGFPLFDIYFSLARCYELDKDNTKSLQILREMQTRFVDHPRLNLVDRQIQKLSALA
jgi:predicted negative regulator of RcsB-dependent stress response